MSEQPRRGLRRYRFTALAVAIGAGAGGTYAHFFGCNGSCPITSSLWTAALYGGAVGLLVAWPGRSDRSNAHQEEGTPE